MISSRSQYALACGLPINFVAIGIVLWVASACSAQKPDYIVQRQQIHSFLSDAGLSEKYASYADCDADGELWVAVSDGLYHYDGHHWRRYTTKNGLPSNYVRCVEFAADGTLWIGTDQGACRLADGKFDDGGTAGKLAGPSIRRIVVDPDGSVWFCCDQWPIADVAAGLTRLQDGEFKTWTTTDGLPSNYVSDYFRDSQGRQFVLTRGGLAQFSGDRFIEPLREAGFPEAETYVWSMVESEHYGLLVGTTDYFYRWFDGRWTAHENGDRRLEHPKLLATADGEIYTAGYGVGAAIYQWRDNHFVTISQSMTQIDGGVQFLIEDSAGAIWIGGYERLLMWERNQPRWTKYAARGRPRWRDSQGGIWFDDSTGMSRMKDERWIQFPGLGPPILGDVDGRVWLQSASGVQQWDGKDGTIPIKVEGLIKLKLQVTDAQGGVWVSGSAPDRGLGLARFDGTDWRVTPLPPRHKKESVCSLTVDPQKGVWVLLGVKQLPPFRLIRVDGQEVSEINLPKRAEVSAPPSVVVREQGQIMLSGYFGLLESTDSGDSWELIQTPALSLSQIRRFADNFWASFSGHSGGHSAVSIYRDGVWESLPGLQGRFVGRDKNRELYLSNQGTIQVIPAKTDQLPPPITTPFTSRSITMVAGNNGEYWVGNAGNAFRYRPSLYPPETTIPSRDRHSYFGDEIRVEVHGRERFRPAGEPSHYFVSTRIDDGVWSSFKPLAGDVRLRNLSVGAHQVQFRLMNESLKVDRSPASFVLEVLPIPIQMRAWFKPVVTLGVLTIAGLAILAMINWLTIRRLATDLQAEVAYKGERLDTTRREFQMLFEDCQDAICLFGADGTLHASNSAADRLLGIESGVGLTMGDLFVESKERARFETELRRGGDVHGLRTRVRGKDASQFDAILSASTHQAHQKDTVGYQVIIRDISDLVELQQRLRETEKMEAIGRMAGGIAHDFNNFLAVVMYGADFIRLQDPNDEEIEKGVQIIIDGAHRAKQLTSQIQTFSRAPSPKLAVIDTYATLSKLPDLLHAVVPENVCLRTELDDDLGSMQADPQQIEQVLVNLAVNACHAMPDGGDLVVEAERVELQQRELDKYAVDSDSPDHCKSFVRITVTDTGHGIDDSNRAQIFDPFFTTKPHGQGTGLGLAIVYGIIQQLRGRIAVVSRPNESTCFEILLPRLPSEVELTQQTDELEPSAAQGSETILLVEDEDNIRELVGRSLRRFGYQVHLAHGGQSALEQIEQLESLDMVISDIVMSGMSGFDLAAYVRDARPEAAILLISGYPQSSENGRLDEIDVPFLRKPFVPDVLAARVRQILDTRMAGVESTELRSGKVTA